jgi:hypothetical protein
MTKNLIQEAVDIDQYPTNLLNVLDTGERGSGQKHDEEYHQSKRIFPTIRTIIITGIFGAIGLGLGIAFGVALGAAGLIFPLVAGVFAASLSAVVFGSLGGMLAGLVGLWVAKVTAPTPVNSTNMGLKTELNTTGRALSGHEINEERSSLTVLGKLGGVAPSEDNTQSGDNEEKLSARNNNDNMLDAQVGSHLVPNETEEKHLASISPN